MLNRILIPGLVLTLTCWSASALSASPDAFTYLERGNVATNVFITSETKTINGTSGPWSVSVSGGNSPQYRIDGGAFTSTTGTISAGQSLTVRHISADAASTTVTTTVTAGTFSTPFKSVTGALDRTPDPFSFGNKGNVAPGALTESPAVTLTGYNTGIPIQPGPAIEYRLGAGGYWSNATGTLAAGQTIKVRHTASSKRLEYTKTYLKVGGVIGYFTTRTQGSIAPVAVEDRYSVPQGQVLTLGAPGVLANDTHATPLTAVLISGPASGLLSFNPDGSFIYTPGADFAGVDRFSYRSRDGSVSSAAATVTIKVTDIPPLTRAGFAARSITPAGTPPAEWAQFFTRQPLTGIWGEPFMDSDNDGCYDAASSGNPTSLPPTPPTDAEAHTDQTWNSDVANLSSVRGVKIYGDGQSSGKWDGIWAGAGFGSQCGEGVLDDVWARAVVIEAGGKTVALVAIDVIGFFNYEIVRIRGELAARYPTMPLDEFAVSSTHTHEASDTMGYWGEQLGVDGKFPAYQAYIRSQVIDAIHDAWLAREPAVARFAQPRITENIDHNSPADTSRVKVRDSRPPLVKDSDLDVGQFARPDGTVIGTLVVWGNHPESLGSNNGFLSSDYATPIRDQLEQEFGGIAIHFSGSVGGLMTPLGVDVPGHGTNATVPRMNEIGRLVAQEAITAIKTESYGNIGTLSHGRRSFYMEADNTALSALNKAGVFDLPTYNGGESWGRDPAGHNEGVPAGTQGTQFKTEMVAITYGPTVFVTVPGELFPELEYGGYGRVAPDCLNPQTTGRPHEPAIRAQFGQARHVFVLGLGMDELGYIVPGYDFFYGPAPAIEYKDVCGEGHYEETVSGSSYMAPWVTCVASELSGKDPWSGAAAHPACAYGNTHSQQSPPPGP